MKEPEAVSASGGQTERVKGPSRRSFKGGVARLAPPAGLRGRRGRRAAGAAWLWLPPCGQLPPGPSGCLAGSGAGWVWALLQLEVVGVLLLQLSRSCLSPPAGCQAARASDGRGQRRQGPAAARDGKQDGHEDCHKGSCVQRRKCRPASVLGAPAPAPGGHRLDVCLVGETHPTLSFLPAIV